MTQCERGVWTGSVPTRLRSVAGALHASGTGWGKWGNCQLDQLSVKLGQSLGTETPGPLDLVVKVHGDPGCMRS